MILDFGLGLARLARLGLLGTPLGAGGGGGGGNTGQPIGLLLALTYAS